MSWNFSKDPMTLACSQGHQETVRWIVGRKKCDVCGRRLFKKVRGDAL